MWDNPRLLNSAAGLLVCVAALLFAFAGLQLLLRSPLFPIRELEVDERLKHTPGRRSRRPCTAASPVISSPSSSPAFEPPSSSCHGSAGHGAPRWPDRIEVSVEEHVALAAGATRRWSTPTASAFPAAARRCSGVPGPAGTEQEVATRYAHFASLVAPLRHQPRAGRAHAALRVAAQARSGLNIMLGRDADSAELRLARFVASYPERSQHRPPSCLRRPALPERFALRMPELRG